MVRNLEFLGYRVLQARNGEEGLSLSRQHEKSIDLVFTDAVMPRLSGPGMVDTLRKEKINTPVLYTTGYADTHGISREEQVLTKPYTTNELAAKIQEFIGTAQT